MNQYIDLSQPSKIQTFFLVEIDKMFLKYVHKCKGQRIAIEPTLKKKARRFTLAHSTQAGQGSIYQEPQLLGRFRQENAKLEAA